jgi:hypothetical protein
MLPLSNPTFSSLTLLSHKEYVTFGDDKKGKVHGTGIIKVNYYFTLNNVVLVDKLSIFYFLSLNSGPMRSEGPDKTTRGGG